VLPSDVFVVSYPRSGNTWLRFLLTNALRPDRTATFTTVGKAVPDIYEEADRALLRRTQPRILKSHEPFDERYGRVLYLVRHPADVAVSYYHYLIDTRVIGAGYEIARFVDSFLAGRLDDFGTWRDHLAGWLDGRHGSANFVLVRYEDMVRSPEDALAAVLALVGAKTDEATIATAVERSTAAELRRAGAPLVRRAQPGAAADELAPELVTRILGAWQATAARVGYA
jgi:hypothetical protein